MQKKVDDNGTESGSAEAGNLNDAHRRREIVILLRDRGNPHQYARPKRAGTDA
ncbi:hypothetical protein D3C81_1128540 [compost metagenome]